MRILKKLLLTVILCACCSCLFAGCQSHYGGIIKGYKCSGERGDYITYVQLEIDFGTALDGFYPYIVIADSYFEYYNCKSTDELFKNENFINANSETIVVEVKDGKGIIEINKKHAFNVSIYFYESVSNSSGLVKINDLTKYIGFLNYQHPTSDYDKLTNQDKSIIKFYGELVETKALEIKQGDEVSYKINAVYEIKSLSNNYLVNVTGKNGFGNGTVTCCVAVVVNNHQVSEIKGVSIVDDDNQALIGSITNNFLNLFVNDYEINKEFSADQGYLVAGASKSSRAICNAVNGAIEYINSMV